MEVERWKTLSRQDPLFRDYLEGSFSATHRALPVRSLNVGSPAESITFEIVSLAEIKRPSGARIAWLLVRPGSLVFSLGTMSVIWLGCLKDGRGVETSVALSSFIGVLFFHIAANLFNDYGDHIKGQDRLRPSGGTRVIQNGWMTARSVLVRAWILSALAALCGLPAIFLHFAPLMIVALASGLVALEFAFQRWHLKARGWSEVVAFALTGPLLASAFAWAISGHIAVSDVVTGGMFGALSLMNFHSGNFENLMSDSQAGLRTWATRAGFDGSQRIFYFVSMLVVIFTLASLYIGPALAPETSFVIGAVSLLPIAFLCRRVARLASPLSSELVGLRLAVQRIGWLTAMMFCLSYGCLFFFAVIR